MNLENEINEIYKQNQSPNMLIYFDELKKHENKDWEPVLLSFIKHQKPGIQLGMTITIFLKYLVKLIQDCDSKNLNSNEIKILFLKIIETIETERSRNNKMIEKCNNILAVMTI
jgi:hypothetical protein